ncbi:hypothetical protein SLEP1_g19003 [Rubroshorea leprosula]|nr:hypothetical protein SLEP1_g19003 [Rubroshorea leprosula]
MCFYDDEGTVPVGSKLRWSSNVLPYMVRGLKDHLSNCENSSLDYTVVGMEPILNTISREAFFVLIINLLTGYTLLLEFNRLSSHTWPIIPYSLDPVVEAYTTVMTTCAIMNFPKFVISLLIADAPGQDSTREGVIYLTPPVSTIRHSRSNCGQGISQSVLHPWYLLISYAGKGLLQVLAETTIWHKMFFLDNEGTLNLTKDQT